MKIHPAAEVFPLLDDAALKLLAEDIADHGQKHPIVLFEGAILDGRNRERACKLAKVKPRYEEWTGGDPIAYVVSANIHRRHLDESQRAMIGARIRGMYEEAARARQHAGVSAKLHEGGKTSEKAAASVNVSARSVEVAARVLEKADPAVVAAVDAGLIPVHSAAQIIDRPADVQRDIVERVRAGTAKNVPQAKRKVDQDRRASAVVPAPAGCELRMGDARELVRKMKERPHLVVTDPPYGIENHNTRRGGKDYADGESYAPELVRDVFSALASKLAADAHLYVFAGYDSVEPFKKILAEFFDVQPNPIIWVKDNHVMCAFDQWYPNKHEYVIFAKVRGSTTSSRLLKDCVPDVIPEARTRFTTHSAEKPPNLIKRFIEQSTVPGELVFDPFMGGGATKVAAVSLGRTFLGFELEKEWIDVARTRTE